MEKNEKRLGIHNETKRRGIRHLGQGSHHFPEGSERLGESDVGGGDWWDHRPLIRKGNSELQKAYSPSVHKGAMAGKDYILGL